MEDCKNYDVEARCEEMGCEGCFYEAPKYKPCEAEEVCKKYNMLVCGDCPHGLLVEKNKPEFKED